MKNSRNVNPVDVLPTEDPRMNVINTTYFLQHLPKQTPRWCHLTSTLWSLVVLDANRHVDPLNLAQFLEVIYWRANGKITGEEFTVLYLEWLNQTNAPNNNNNNVGKKKSTIGISVLRSLLLEKKYFEKDLDLFLGMIIYENNMRLLNKTINYNIHHQLYNKTKNVNSSFTMNNLEVVTETWINLSEELFFLLDVAGYGALQYEEIAFFAGILLTGLQSWKNELELETDISVSSLTATTIQLLREMEVTWYYSNIEMSKILLTDRYYDNMTIHTFKTFPPTTNNNNNNNNNSFHSTMNPYYGNNATSSNHNQSFVNSTYSNIPSSGYGQYNNQPTNNTSNSPNKYTMKNNNINNSAKYYAVTLVMFKRYLLKKNLGENEITLLITHVKCCLEKIMKLAMYNSADELVHACSVLEHKHFNNGNVPNNTVIAPPKLWQQAILLATGYGTSTYLPFSNLTSSMSVAGSTMPPIMLFLFTDGEKLLSGLFRAIEFSVNEVYGYGFENTNTNSQSNQQEHNVLQSITAATDELYANAKRIYCYYKCWGLDSYLYSKDVVSHTQNTLGSMNHSHTTSNMNYYQYLVHTTTSSGANQSLGDQSNNIATDPLYQLIVMTLWHYKRLQSLYTAALFDFAVQEFSTSPNVDFSSNSQQQQYSNHSSSYRYELAILCAVLLPTNREVFMEMKLEESDQNMNNSLNNTTNAPNSTSQDQTDSAAAAVAVLEEENDEVMMMEDLGFEPAVSSSNDVNPAVSSANNQDNASINSNITNNSKQIARRISMIPAIEKRRSSMLPSTTTTTNTNATPVITNTATTEPTITIAPTIITNPTNNTTTPAPATGANKGRSNTPNYTRATTTYLNKIHPNNLPTTTTTAPTTTTATNSKASTTNTAENTSAMDKEASEAIWKPLLTTSSRPLSTPASRPNTTTTTSTTTTNTNNNTGSMWADQEAMIVNELLTVTDVNRQSQLIELLRQVKLLQQQQPQQPQQPQQQQQPAQQQQQPAQQQQQHPRNSVTTNMIPVNTIDNNQQYYTSNNQAQAMNNDVPLTAAMLNTSQGPSNINSTSNNNTPHAGHDDAQSQRSDVSVPSSIAELLQRYNNSNNNNPSNNSNTSPGKYAALLREILRKMSKDDSHVRIKSLEEVLQLGQQLMRKDQITPVVSAAIHSPSNKQAPNRYTSAIMSPPIHSNHGQSPINVNHEYSSQSAFFSNNNNNNSNVDHGNNQRKAPPQQQSKPVISSSSSTNVAVPANNQQFSVDLSRLQSVNQQNNKPTQINSTTRNTSSNNNNNYLMRNSINAPLPPPPTTVINNSYGQPKIVGRMTQAPGHMPNEVRKNNKRTLAFGHPV